MSKPQKKLKKKLIYVLGAVLLVAFAGFSLASFKEALTPYVSYGEARDAAGRAVQVAGGLQPESTSYDEVAGYLHFTLVDKESGELMPVRYEGIKPANFNEAISIVAIGRFDDASGELQANKLLVKCPSKYQGAEVKEYS
jgi:cytochrome c-type biogenesis protein CcmE